ncbi:MAG: hypothetical protein IJY66_01940 [Clostridia bacterium]|nr:hypothetical protein [Clostridia bacterium]
MTSLIGCSAPPDDDEVPPEQMRCASVAGAPYRLYLPSDWNLTTDAGVSGGYYSMNDAATITAQLYDNAEGRTAEEFIWEVLVYHLTDVFGGEIDTTEDDPIDTVLGTVVGEVDYSVAAKAFRYRGVIGHIMTVGMAVVAPFDGQMLVLTYHAREDVYDTYLPGMEAAVTNFRWLGRPYEPEDPVHTVDPDAPAPQGMQLASNDDVAYRFYVPESWVLDTKLPTSSAYCSEAYRSNVTVTVYMPEVDKMTAEEYWALCLADLNGEDPDEAVIRNMEVLSDTEGTLGGRPSHTYVYRGQVAGKAYRFSQTIAAYRGMVYTLTYTAAEDVFDSHLDELEQMIAAFEFRGND